jgi:hypothetical protein
MVKNSSKLRFEVQDGRVKVGTKESMYVEAVDGDTTLSYTDYNNTVFVDIEDFRNKQYIRVVNSENGTFVARITDIGDDFVEYDVY